VSSILGKVSGLNKGFATVVERCTWNFFGLPHKVFDMSLERISPYISDKIVLLFRNAKVYSFGVSGRFDIGNLHSYLDCCEKFSSKIT
jgi:hypothetical protein